MNTTEVEYRNVVAALPRANLAPVYLTVAVLLGVLTIWAFVSSRGSSQGGLNGTTLIALGVLAAGAGAGVMILYTSHIERTRARALYMIMNHLGIECIVKPHGDDRPGLFASFAGLPMLRKGDRGVRMWAGGVMGKRRIEVIEHRIVEGGSESSRTVTHTAIATPCSPVWPRLSLTPRHALGSLWASVTGRDFRVENPAFTDRWIVRTDNPDFAMLFLTPEVQAFLASAPGGETWHVCRGSICWVVRSRIKPRDFPAFIHRVLALREVIPPELDHWSRGLRAGI